MARKITREDWAELEKWQGRCGIIKEYKHYFVGWNEQINYRGEKYYIFGKIYNEPLSHPFFDMQGFQTFSTLEACINEALSYCYGGRA
jgi:hypothetical protein